MHSSRLSAASYGRIASCAWPPDPCFVKCQLLFPQCQHHRARFFERRSCEEDGLSTREGCRLLSESHHRPPRFRPVKQNRHLSALTASGSTVRATCQWCPESSSTAAMGERLVEGDTKIAIGATLLSRLPSICWKGGEALPAERNMSRLHR